MKNLSVIMVCLLITFSCSNKNKKDNKSIDKRVEKRNEKSITKKNFLGIWRIDSIGENKIVTQRMNNDSTHFQAFFFTFDYKIMVTQKEGQDEKNFVIGDFIVFNDSVFFLDEKYNKIVFRYKYEFFGNNQLKLMSGTSISENNPAKPLLFMKKIPNEKSMKILKDIKP
jgi:hypothetical protein